MPTSPTSITAAPLVPNPVDSSNFNARVFPYTNWISSAASQISALSTNVYNNSLEASVSAANALSYRDLSSVSAIRAGAYSSAIPWISGATYTSGTAVYSLVDFLTYRRLNTGSGTVDPKFDTTNYQCLHNIGSLPVLSVSGNPVQAYANIHYLMVGFTVLVLPPSPPVGTYLEITNLSENLSSRPVSATNSLMGLNEGINLNFPNVTVGMLFVGQPTGWAIQ